MKRLVITTLLTLALTGFVITSVGRSAGKRSMRALLGHGSEAAKSIDPLATEAGLRWRHNQPTHWRACLLQH